MNGLFRALILAAVVVAAVSSFAAPVEYVRVCDAYGVGFFYIPGTDTCVNSWTGETRTETEEGTWFAQTGRLAGSWVGIPKGDCMHGRVASIGTINAADLTINAHGRYESGSFPLTLQDNEFISKVMIRGGFVTNSRSNFCIAFKDATSGEYSVLGCHDTASLVDQQAVWSFTPLRSVPPAHFTSPYAIVGANGDRWPAPDPAFEGALECWVCVQRIWLPDSF